MGDKKSAFGSALSQRGSPKLTEVQAEVLYLLTKEFLTIKQIAIRRGTKVRTIQSTVKKLKDLGLVNNAYQEVRFFRPTNAINFSNQEVNNNMIRLHGEEWNIKILFLDDYYKELLNKNNFIDVDGNTVRLSRNSLEVYSGKSFYGDDASKATERGLEYWNRFFNNLEIKFNIIISKRMVNNKRRVNAHYAEVGNELAKSCEERGDRIRIYSREDGKLWFTIDNSFNLHEAECLHPTESKDDMDMVKGFFNDLRGGRWHEIMAKVEVMFKFQDKYAVNIETHLNVMKQMEKTLKKIEEKSK